MVIITIQENYYDLLSNVITHSYFSLLENYCRFETAGTKNSLTLTAPLYQAAKSFLFIAQNFDHALDLLEHQVFRHYLPYQYLSKNKILSTLHTHHPEAAKYFRLSKSHLSLGKAKRCYIQTVSHFKKDYAYSKIAVCNAAFIHLYLYIIYHQFKDNNIPELFKAYTASSFINQVKACSIALAAM